MHAAAAAFLRHHPVEDDHSGPTTAPSDAEHRAGMPPRSHDEQRRHMQLAQWHMNMAQRHSPPLGSLDVDSFFPYAPPAFGDAGARRRRADAGLRGPAAAPSGARLLERPERSRRPRRRRSPEKASAPGAETARALSYNVFIREEIPRLKRKDPSLNHREAFKAAARNWAHSPLILRSAAYAPRGPFHALLQMAVGDGRRERQRNVRLEIMAKLHPHLLRSRRAIWVFGTTTKTAQQKLPQKLQQKRERGALPPTAAAAAAAAAEEAGRASNAKKRRRPRRRRRGGGVGRGRARRGGDAAVHQARRMCVQRQEHGRPRRLGRAGVGSERVTFWVDVTFNKTRRSTRRARVCPRASSRLLRYGSSRSRALLPFQAPTRLGVARRASRVATWTTATRTARARVGVSQSAASRSSFTPSASYRAQRRVGPAVPLEVGSPSASTTDFPVPSRPRRGRRRVSPAPREPVHAVRVQVDRVQHASLIAQRKADRLVIDARAAGREPLDVRLRDPRPGGWSEATYAASAASPSAVPSAATGSWDDPSVGSALAPARRRTPSASSQPRR